MLTQLATLMNVDAFMNKVEEISSANPDPFSFCSRLHIKQLQWSSQKNISFHFPYASSPVKTKSYLSLKKKMSNFGLTWFLMFRFPKVLRTCGTFPPAVPAAILALALTTLPIIDATPPNGITWSSCVEVPRIEPGSESLSADWPLCILAWKELFCLLDTPVIFGPVLRFRQQPAWWRHRRGWQRKHEVGLIWWPEPMLEVSGSDEELDLWSPSLENGCLKLSKGFLMYSKRLKCWGIH